MRRVVLALLLLGSCTVTEIHYHGDTDPPPAEPPAETDTDTDSDTDLDPPEDTGWDAPPETRFIQVPKPDCHNGDLRVRARTQGWTTGSGLVNIWEQAAPEGQRWHEQHELRSVAHGEQGGWDEVEARMKSAAWSYQPNVATLFWCSGSEVDHENVYALRVYDEGNLADCALLASPGVPEGIQEVLAWDTDDGKPGFVHVTRREEITAANCTIWPFGP